MRFFFIACLPGKLRKATDVESAAAPTAGGPVVPQASNTAEGPEEPSVEEEDRPVEMDATGPAEEEAARTEVVEAAEPLVVLALDEGLHGSGASWPR